jgi:hypothetical protein
MKCLGHICLLFLSLLYGCNKPDAPDCFKSNGKEQRETRFVGKFNSVEVNNNVYVTIYQGNDFKVEVLGPKNELTKIETLLQDTLLVIKNKNECAFVRGYKRKVQVYVTLPKLKYAKNNSVFSMQLAAGFKQDTLQLRNENSGDIVVNGNYGQVYVSSHGNGDVRLNGVCDQLLIYTNGLNFIYGQNMVVKSYAYVATLSIGDVYINGSELDQLDCHIHKSGNVYYTGNPQVFNNTFEDYGSGKIIKLP